MIRRVLPVEIEQQVKQHAIDDYPNEAVGFQFEDEYVRVRNIADNPKREFAINPMDYARASKRGLSAIIHSHPTGNGEPDDEDALAPSQEDIQCIVATGLPLGICVCDGKTCETVVMIGGRKYIPELVGRDFRHGPSGSDNAGDCVALIQDYYWLNLGIPIMEKARRWNWWQHSKTSLYDDNLPRAGFRQVYEPQEHDVALMKIESHLNNHAAVVLPDDKILHQLAWRKSMIDGHSKWRRKITAYWRHNSL